MAHRIPIENDGKQQKKSFFCWDCPRTFGGTYVYTNIDPDIKMKQLDERNKNPGKPPFDPYLAIEVLRAVIKHLEH